VIRTQIQLEEEQYRRLKALAGRRSKSISQLVREGVAQVLEEENRAAAWERLLEAAGSCHADDEPGNVSVAHDRYLVDAYRHD